jgi:hypothetical protein
VLFVASCVPVALMSLKIMLVMRVYMCVCS